MERLDDRLARGRLDERRVQVRVEVVRELDAGRSRAGRPSRPASAPPGTRRSSAAGAPQHGRGAPRSAAAARPPRRAGAASRPCASSGAPSPSRSPAARAPPRRRRPPAPPGRPRRSARRRPSASARPRSRSRRRRSRPPRPSSASGRPGRLRVPVDRDDAQPELLRAQDGAALVAARADEEDGSQLARDATDGRGRGTPSVPALDLAAVRAGEPRRDAPAAERPADARHLRPAVDLRAHRRRRARARTGSSRTPTSCRHAAAARGASRRPDCSAASTSRCVRRSLRPDRDRQVRRRRAARAPGRGARRSRPQTRLAAGGALPESGSSSPAARASSARRSRAGSSTRTRSSRSTTSTATRSPARSSPSTRTSRFVQGDVLDAERDPRRSRRARRTSSTARRSRASTPCSRARCGRCA